ncbi:MAG TPA: nucleotidyl transferase AbiEii/AbiGii toxin family protein [Steroidobacteraceae bacterium]|nr:nucleotidyl transferase AbiEii/AbiGii toxin family protein [Steroidobacteraceae bacterium]
MPKWLHVGAGSGPTTVNSPPAVDSLLGALEALMTAMKSADVPVVVVGGVAVALLGRPRFTRDIDVLVELEESRWPTILEAGRALGIGARIDHPLEFARRSRVLLLRHEPSQIDIDVILGGLPFERATVASGQLRSLGGFSVRLPQAEDLMIMKAIAQRPQDLLDLEGLIATHTEANLSRVRQSVAEFSVAATMPSLLEEFDRVVARVQRPR